MHEDSPLIEAIALWEKITGVAPPDAKGFWSTGAGLGTWALRDTYKELKEALELDPSEVTATLLLGKFLEEYLKQASTSMADLLDKPDEHIETLRQAKRLREIVGAEDIVQARDSFILGLKAALARYGAGDREDVQKVLANHAAVAMLRRDALRAVEKLRVDQFLEGDPEPENIKPIFVNTVHRWWNINSLLKAMTVTSSGVSLNMIRDPNAYESYFAFAIRNGGNLFVLTDVPEFAHPLQASMSRRPGRELADRAERNWFPYDLLGVEHDDRGDLVDKARSDSTTIALYQPDTLPLKRISELEAHETIWTTMMLDLIVHKFWRRGFRAKQLSYTAEMIKFAPILLEHAKRAGLPVVQDKPLEMSELTIADIHTDACVEAQIGKKYDQPNRWLEERYKDRVKVETLNLIGSPDRQMAIEHKTGALIEVDTAALKKMHPWTAQEITKAQTAMVQMAATKFGPPEKLEADRRFLARYNYAEQIDDYAAAEFRERKDEVVKWYVDRCRKNLPALLTWAANEEIWLDRGVFNGFSTLDVSNGVSVRVADIDDIDELDGGKKRRIFYAFLKHYDLTFKPYKDPLTKRMNYSDLGYRIASGVGRNLGGNFYAAGHRYSGPSCAITEAKASTASIFYPTKASELAVLAGVTVDKLPDVLRHWDLMNPYRGNCILDRIDPLVWRVKNPWATLDLRIRIPLSVRGRQKIVKAGAQMPPLRNVADVETAKKGLNSTTVRMGGKQRDYD